MGRSPAHDPAPRRPWLLLIRPMLKARQILLVTLVATAMVGDARASERVAQPRAADPACDATSAAGRMLERLRATVRRTARAESQVVLRRRDEPSVAATASVRPPSDAPVVRDAHAPYHFRLPPPVL